MLGLDELRDLMVQFDKEYPYKRLDKVSTAMWRYGAIYQDGLVNELFAAYSRGYACGKALHARPLTSP